MIWQQIRRNPYSSPFLDLTSIERSLNRFASELADDSAYPPLNLYASSEMAVVIADLPGVSAEALDISLKDEVLVLSAERLRDEAEIKAEDKLMRAERPYGKFTRKVRLPFRVDADKVEARFTNGVLRISLPRAEADKPKKIAIVQ